MAKFRQHNYSAMYLVGQEVAEQQLNNKGMCFASTEKSVTPKERAEFWQGYHAYLAEQPALIKLINRS